MTIDNAITLKLFYCYAREDKNFCDELDGHLSNLKRQYHIISWSDREINPGTEWEKVINTHLNTANLILLLISSHFMASKFCYSIEMKRALKRHQEGSARVIPIILRRVDWENAPFSFLQVLPTDAKPITQWDDKDQAYWDTVQGIRKVVQDLSLSLKAKEEEESALHNTKLGDETLLAAELPILVSPDDIDIWNDSDNVLHEPKYSDELRSAPDQATHFASKNITTWDNENNLPHEPNYNDETILTISDQAIRVAPKNATAWNNKGITLHYLKRYDEALSAYDQAIHFAPKDATAWNNKGIALHYLKRYDEALFAYDQAILLAPKDTAAWYNKVSLLDDLKHDDEAQQTQEKGGL